MLGLSGDKGKSNGSYYLGFRLSTYIWVAVKELELSYHKIGVIGVYTGIYGLGLRNLN